MRCCTQCLVAHDHLGSDLTPTPKPQKLDGISMMCVWTLRSEIGPQARGHPALLRGAPKASKVRLDRSDRACTAVGNVCIFLSPRIACSAWSVHMDHRTTQIIFRRSLVTVENIGACKIDLGILLPKQRPESVCLEPSGLAARCLALQTTESWPFRRSKLRAEQRPRAILLAQGPATRCRIPFSSATCARKIQHQTSPHNHSGSSKSVPWRNYWWRPWPAIHLARSGNCSDVAESIRRSHRRNHQQVLNGGKLPFPC
jgi:hypothetical protein